MKKLLFIALFFCLKQLNAQCSLTITGNTVVCDGNPTTLTASGATNYTWQPSGAQTAAITILPTTNMVYTVTGTTGTCTATNTVAITITPIPTITVTSPAPYCPGSLVASTDYNITTSPYFGVTYTWTATNHTGTGMPANGIGAAPGASYNAPANPTLINQVGVVSYTPSLNGCIGLITTDTIIIKPTPFVDPVPTQFYCSNQVTNPINFTCHPTGGTPIFTWMEPGSSGQTSNGSVPSFTAVNNTTSTLVTTFTVNATLNGCIGPNSTFNITVYPNPVAKFTYIPGVCEGVPMHFIDQSFAYGGLSINLWQWDMDDNASIDATSQNPQYIIPTTGQDSVVLYVGTNSVPSCTAKITEAVFVNPKPVANFVGVNLQGCSPLQTAFTDQSTPVGQIASWSWDFGNTQTTTSMFPPPINYTNPSTTQNVYYTVSLTVRSDSGCVSTITKTNYIEVLSCAGNGIEKYTGSNELNIYPNPNNGNFVIETNLSEKQTLQILDVTGKFVLQQSISGKTTIDANNLDNGIYFVQINTGDGFYNKKIIVQH